jgi:uncharacterized membrane-anchored protein YhcB (DUF1043 family)
VRITFVGAAIILGVAILFIFLILRLTPRQAESQG